jgi:hypothetical protein
MTLALDERVKPLRIAGALDPHRDGAWQGAIELFDCLVIVGEPSLLHLARFGVEDGHLLIPTVQVTSHECHDTAPPSLLLRADQVIE